MTKGVRFIPAGVNRHGAYIQYLDEPTIWLGSYGSPSEARAARKGAERFLRQLRKRGVLPVRNVK